MEHKVIGCVNCPFLIDKHKMLAKCNHPSSNGLYVEYAKIEGYAVTITPDNCPLNKEPITIIKTNG